MGKQLPKLPYGEGSFSYETIRGKEMVRYRKTFMGKSLTVYGKDARECMQKMKKKQDTIEEDSKLEHPLDGSGIAAILEEAMKHWLVVYKKPVLKPRSYDTLEGTINNHITGTMLGHTSMENITSTNLQEALNKTIEEKSESTTKKLYGLFNQFFAFYYAKDLNHNPMNLVKMPKKQVVFDPNNPIDSENELVVLSDSEIKALTDELNKPYSNGRIGYSYGHMLLFIMWSFARVGEVIAIQYKDIDFEKKTLRIYKGYNRVKVRDSHGNAQSKYEWVLSNTKTKKGRRVVYLCDEAMKNLQLHLEENFPDAEPDTFIFFSKQGNPMADQFLNVMLAKALKRAGINKHVTIHGLRHTGISYFLRHGVSIKVISEMAGHNDVSTTNDIYYSVIEEQFQDAIDHINKIDE